MDQEPVGIGLPPLAGPFFEELVLDQFVQGVSHRPIVAVPLTGRFPGGMGLESAVLSQLGQAHREGGLAVVLGPMEEIQIEFDGPGR